MEVSVLFFGSLVDITGTTIMHLQDVGDTDVLNEVLQKQFPRLKEVTSMMAVNRKIIREKTILNGQTEVALLPPFSGG